MSGIKGENIGSRKHCMRYDNVIIFESLTLMPFCLEKTSIRNLVVKGLTSVKYARIMHMITFVLFYIITIYHVPHEVFEHEA